MRIINVGCIFVENVVIASQNPPVLVMLFVLVILSGSSCLADIVDGFEDGNLNEYSGDVSKFTISDAPSRSGTYALRYDGIPTRNERQVGLHSVSGLSRYFKKGDTVEYDLYIDDQSNVENLVVGFRFGMEASSSDSFEAYYSGTHDELRIRKSENGQDTVLSRLTLSSSIIPKNEWTKIVVRWNKSDSIHVSWKEANGIQLGGVCATDSSFSENKGIGVFVGSKQGSRQICFIDDIRVVERNRHDSEFSSDGITITAPSSGRTYDSIQRILKFKTNQSFENCYYELQNALDSSWSSVTRREIPCDQPVTGIISGTGEVTYRVYGKPSGSPLHMDQVTFSVSCSNGKRRKIDPELWQVNPYKYVHLQNLSEVRATRRQLIEEIYRSSGSLPTRTGTVMKDVGGVPSLSMDSVENWDRIDAIEVHSEKNTIGYVFLVTSNQPSPNALFIHKAGHAGDHSEGGRKQFTQEMLDRGYDVLLVGMYGINFNQARYGHNELAGKQTESFNPLKLFHDHVAVGLNYALSQEDYRHVFMTGKSGGGWSTATYGAMDQRIDRIYPIAGTQPIYIHRYQEENGYHTWDYEQGARPFTRSFYETYTYLDHYLLATAGSETGGIFVNVLEDDCCFYGVNNRITEEVVKTVLRKQFSNPSSFQWYIDDTVKSHEISSEVVNLILNDADQHVKK